LSRRRNKRQGILPFVVKMADRDDVTARVGLPLVIETARAFRLDEEARKLFGPPRRKSDFGTDAKLEAFYSLIGSGGDRVGDIRILAEDKGLMRLLDRQFPSPDALLDFLRDCHDEKCWKDRPKEKKAFVPPESAGLQALDKLNRELIHRAANPKTKVATIDHDGTIIESHKRDAMVAYEGTRGYQPLVAVWAEEQLVVADEFRDGNVAGGEDPLSSVKRAFGNLPSSVNERYYRGDSASYYTPLLKYLVGEEIAFGITADMTKELRRRCVALPERTWSQMEKRASETVDLAEVEFEPGDWPKNATPLRYVALRITPLQDEMFEERPIKYFAVVSNRTEMSATDLILWHRGKAGTIEHVHRSMKDELGAGVMPCQEFGANAAWFRINAITHNLLTALKRHALPERYRQARPKRLRFEIFTLPGKLANHEGQVSVGVSAAEERFQEIVAARQRLLAILETRN
jgi:hypothetical protein